MRGLILGAFITPSYLGAIGWILLAGPNAGWINKVWMAVTGASTGFSNIYSFGGLVWVTALYAFPYIFVFTTDALERVSTEMEEAANILGAGGLRTTFRVTLPLVTPAILGGAIVVFLDTVALFGTPAIIALPARIHVLTLELWGFFQFPVQAEVAAAYAIPLVLITVALFTVQRTVLGRRGYVALTGKGGSRELQRLGAWRFVVLLYALFIVSMAVILPYAALAQAAFSRAWGQGFSWGNLTLENFRFLLIEDPTARDTIIGTFTYSAATACLAVALALVVAYMVEPPARRARGRRAQRVVHAAAGDTRDRAGDRVLRLLGAAAACPLRHRRDPDLRLHRALPADRLYELPRRDPGAEPGDGGGRADPGRRPPARRLARGRAALEDSLVGAWLLVFIPASRELSTAIFLTTSKTRVISVMMLDLSENGSFETLAALGFFLLGVTILIVMVGYKLVGRDFMLRRG